MWFKATSAALLVVLAAVLGDSVQPSQADPLPPTISNSVAATFVGGSLTINGSGFVGSVGSNRFVTFSYLLGSSIVPESSATTWSDTEITLALPADVRSGTFQVTVDPPVGDPVSSTAVPLTVFGLTQLTNDGFNLTLAVSPIDGRVWINEENRDRHLEVVNPLASPTFSQYSYNAQPIFVTTLPPCDSPQPPCQSTYTGWGESVDIESTGTIWATEGGKGQYLGGDGLINTSRVLRITPDSAGSPPAFGCFTVPGSNPGVAGVSVDVVNNMIWYAESTGNAISGFRQDETSLSTDCNRAVGALSDPVCAIPMTLGCHTRCPLPTGVFPVHVTTGGDGAVWFAEMWGRKVGKLNPADCTFIEVPLPDADNPCGLSLCALGPWELDFDAAGKLWLAEYAYGTVARLDPALMATENCLALDTGGANPCVARFDVGPDARYVHTISAGSDGRVWFTACKGGLPDLLGTVTTVGFISTQHNNEIVRFPEIVGPCDGGGGIEENPVHHKDVWFGIMVSHIVGRMYLDDDGDGIPDANDNCLGAANAGQENTDLNFIDQTPPSTQDDRTWPNSDTIGDACDTDDDNDGLADTAETAGCNGSGPLAPLNRDTDGDRVLDGPECALGTNPANVASKPTTAQCAAFLGVGVSVDTDGDRILDRVEYCGYNTNRLVLDSDDDQDGFPITGKTKDGCEAASLNNDRVVNSGDKLMLVNEIIREPTSSLRLASFDINKDGGVNSGDQLLQQQFIDNAGSCP